jgi:hypothetical protein
MAPRFIDSGPLENTFDTVDEKLAEMEFFLRHMAGVRMDEFAFKCYLSAYLAAARTATLALQRFSHIPGFASWYEPHQARLKADPIARFLFDARNDHLHGAPYPIAGAVFDQSTSQYYFARLDGTSAPPDDDVVTVCREHLVKLLELTLDCYATFGIHIDPQQHYTKEHFESTGRDIEQAECEVFGWVCESLIEEGYTEDDRWHELRGHVKECQINNLFYSYLGKTTPQPKEPEHYADFAFTPDDQGWVMIPAGFKSRGDYWKQYPDRTPPDEWWSSGEDESEPAVQTTTSRYQRQESPHLALRTLFNQWSDNLIGPLLIRLTVLYEDLRIEHRATLADDLGAVDVNAVRYRRFYFQRRIYATLHEIHGALHQLNCSSEFCRYLQEGSATRWRTWGTAIDFFEKNGALIKRRRNVFGAHFGNKAALRARDNMSDAIAGQMACVVDQERGVLDPAHLFAHELAALVFYWGVEATESREFSTQADQFIREAIEHAGNAFLAISARCFLPYFGWEVGP